MKFTYSAYADMIAALRRHGYSFADYHDHAGFPKKVILRHDVDMSLRKAAIMAEFEKELGIRSTYFLLLRTDFYNLASTASQREVQRILTAGHEIGLHFDEVATACENVPEAIREETEILSRICRTPITTVSMHRPSKQTLEADYTIPGIINSYGQTFFRGFKYLSDSRMRWREPVDEIIESEQYDELHILTHPFWYFEEEQTMPEILDRFIRSASPERYDQAVDNFTDLGSVLSKESIVT